MWTLGELQTCFVLCLQVCEFFMEQCTANAGIHMHMSSNPTEIIRESNGTLTVKLEPAQKKDSAANQDKAESAAAGSSSSRCSEVSGNDQVVLAVGRAAKTKGLGLEEVGVEMGEWLCGLLPTTLVTGCIVTPT
jgi:pyruvate/2-oxoglutarate dehydrogenase complex dihydrolipoamide dehydrogenase (E3) component